LECFISEITVCVFVVITVTFKPSMEGRAKIREERRGGEGRREKEDKMRRK
jgi:hypothetical protein